MPSMRLLLALFMVLKCCYLCKGNLGVTTYSRLRNANQLMLSPTHPGKTWTTNKIHSCAARCASVESMPNFMLAKDKSECRCFGDDLYVDLNKPYDAAQGAFYVIDGTELTLKKKILIINQKVGHYFGACSPDCDTDNPESPTFSIASSTENYRNSQGFFIFELCYIIVYGYDCFIFRQSNNPFTTTTRTDYELLYSPVDFVIELAGLAADTPGECITDGVPPSSRWNFCVGAVQPWKDDFPIPGVSSPSRDVFLPGEHVQLYVWE